MVTLVAQVDVKAARKRHQCQWCYEHIEVGQPYVRQRLVDVRDAWVWKAHPECHAAAGTLDEWDLEVSVGVQFARGCTAEVGDPNCECAAHVAWRNAHP